MKKYLILFAAVLLLLPSCRKDIAAEPVIGAVSAFADEENFLIKYTVSQSYIQDGEKYDFEKQYDKYAGDTVSGERYYEQSGLIFLNGEQVGEPYVSFYPPLKVLTVNNSFTAGKEYDDYIVSSDRLFWRTDITLPTVQEIESADVSERDGAICYTVRKPDEESVRSIGDYIGSELKDIGLSYTVKDGKLIGYTQEYTVDDGSDMQVSVTAVIEASGDGVEVYDDKETAGNTDPQ